jgi:F-type H+-transporting ATPase subunit alpha
MTSKGKDIAAAIRRQIEQFGVAVTMVDVGTVTEVGDGIARIRGLGAARYSELLQFPRDIMGVAMNLEEDSVAAVILGEYASLKEGDEVLVKVLEVDRQGKIRLSRKAALGQTLPQK